MKITNYTLVGLINELEKFSEKKLPQKISYAITRNIMLATKEYQIYESQFNKLMESYGDKMIRDDDGNIKRNNMGIPFVEESCSEEFNKEIEELLNFEIEIDFYTVDEDVFNYNDNGRYDALTVKDILLLQSMLCIQNCNDSMVGSDK